MRKNKGIALLTLCIVIVIIIFGIFLLLGGSIGDNTTSSSTTTKEDRTIYVAKCSTISYESLARNPAQYKGNYYKFTGEVIQVINDGNDVTLRVNVTANRYQYSGEIYYTDTILVTYTYSSSYESRILEDDIITIYGKSAGSYTYTSVLGASVTVPAIVAGYIDIN